MYGITHHLRLKQSNLRVQFKSIKKILKRLRVKKKNKKITFIIYFVR